MAIKRCVLDEGAELRDQMWLDRPSGRMYLDVTWSPIRDDSGRITGVTSVTIDMTRMKMAEEALKENEAKYRGLFENSHEGVSLHRLVYDNDGNIIDAALIDANPAAIKMFGINPLEESRGKRFSESTRPEIRNDVLEMGKQMNATRGAVSKQVHVDINGGDYMVTAVPLGNDLVNDHER